MEEAIESFFPLMEQMLVLAYDWRPAASVPASHQAPATQQLPKQPALPQTEEKSQGCVYSQSGIISVFHCHLIPAENPVYWHIYSTMVWEVKVRLLELNS